MFIFSFTVRTNKVLNGNHTGHEQLAQVSFGLILVTQIMKSFDSGKFYTNFFILDTGIYFNKYLLQ